MISHEGSLDEYRFVLRDPMPRGFVENDTIPELPVVHAYLAKVNGVVSTLNSWRDYFTKNFKDHISQQPIPVRDKSIRLGIQINHSDGMVFVHNEAPSEICYLGNLEKVA